MCFESCAYTPLPEVAGPGLRGPTGRPGAGADLQAGPRRAPWQKLPGAAAPAVGGGGQSVRGRGTPAPGPRRLGPAAPRPRRRPSAGTSRPAPGTFVLGCSLRSNQTAFVTKGQHGGVPTSGGARLHMERRRDMAGRGPSPQRWGRSGPWRPELPPGGVRHRLSSERHVSVRSASEDCSYFFGPQFPQLENGAKCPRRGCCELADVTCSGQRLTQTILSGDGTGFGLHYSDARRLVSSP